MKNEYLNYLRSFLKYKLHTLDKKNIKDDFDVIVLDDRLSDEKVSSIDELHSMSNLIASKGLKQITPISNAIKNFYKFLIDSKCTFADINTVLLTDYINRICIDSNLSYGTRSNYKNSLTAFFTYIDNEFKNDFKFNIGKIKVTSIGTSSKSKEHLVDWLDTPTIIKINKEILKYPFNKKDNDFERNRDILIFRLFLFSGILPNEMVELTLESFVFEDEYMTLHIDGIGSRNRNIPLPKAKLVRYHNQYLKVRDTKSKNFFYSPSESANKIDSKFLSIVVKRLLEFSKIDIKDKTPKMLRKTYAIFLNNEKNEDGFTQPEKNIQYLLGITNITTLRKLLKYHSIELMTASKVFDGLNI